MKILVTGASGYVGATIAPRLRADGHEVVGFARDRRRVSLDLPVVEGDVLTGAGLAQALDGVQIAYYLIHSMEASSAGPFGDREQASALRFGEAATAAGVERVVYLGGPVPSGGPASPHLASRLNVERTLREAGPELVALRASIVIGAHSRPFRFLVRLVERMPVLPFPAWRGNRSAPVDERDMIEVLIGAATSPEVAGATLDIAGPETISYGGLILRIRELMLLRRPTLRLGAISATPIASRVAAVIAGEQPELIAPLMESLETDLLPSQPLAATALGVRLHALNSAIEHALGVWERSEPLAAR